MCGRSRQRQQWQYRQYSNGNNDGDDDSRRDGHRRSIWKENPQWLKTERN
ncbi:Hypothetical protein RY70_447 [Bifidobacterium bifidum]|uniref:Uncharacterized protein n=1 Tax=Bifidobacterium bifidum LMG 13195 TaxID=1207542 RepID=A0A286TDU1_BIFBI|nr:Hypothetical protein RY70_447 [Bifidobacterium bifidum]BBA48377.1 hypothetical protein BBJK_02017 [Bifidobacterium bifidum LMG 13195]